MAVILKLKDADFSGTNFAKLDDLIGIPSNGLVVRAEMLDKDTRTENLANEAMPIVEENNTVWEVDHFVLDYSASGLKLVDAAPNEYTISVVFKVLIAGGYDFIYAGDGLSIGNNGGRLSGKWTDTGGAVRYLPNTDCIDDTRQVWKQIVMTKTLDYVTIRTSYADTCDIYESFITVPEKNPNNPLRIGKGGTYVTSPTYDIAQVLLWDRVLTEEEISKVMGYSKEIMAKKSISL